MIIFPKLIKPGPQSRLELTAYGVVSELFAFQRVLNAATAVEIPVKNLGFDRIGREGRHATLTDPQIQSLEAHLNVQFVDYENETVALIATGAGQSFCCREVTNTGTGKGREEIDAVDADAALFKCGLVARRNRWATGVANRGPCSD